MENIVLEYEDSYGVYIHRNVEVGKWDNGHDTGTLFTASQPEQALRHIKWMDLSKMGIWTRKIDGSFYGCTNSAWYITEDEADALITLDGERAEKAEDEREASEAAEAEYERHRQAVLKMMDDDIYPYC